MKKLLLFVDKYGISERQLTIDPFPMRGVNFLAAENKSSIQLLGIWAGKDGGAAPQEGKDGSPVFRSRGECEFTMKGETK